MIEAVSFFHTNSNANSSVNMVTEINVRKAYFANSSCRHTTSDSVSWCIIEAFGELSAGSTIYTFDRILILSSPLHTLEAYDKIVIRNAIHAMGDETVT